MSAKFPRGGEQGLFWPAVYLVTCFSITLEKIGKVDIGL